MILSGQSIRRLCQEGYLVSPWTERTVINGKSSGISIAGYDIRIAQSIYMEGRDFALASTIERFKMPNDVIGLVKDKSSWARRGLSVFNTVIEPGWEGYLTLELANNSADHIGRINEGDPIAQIIFQRLDEPAEKPYDGKYQNQENRPVEAIYEKD